MRKILSIVLFAATQNGYTSVDQLFLKSLKGSKQVEIINLTKKKSLSDLSATTSQLFPSIDLVNSNNYGNNYADTTIGKDEIDSKTALSISHKVFQGGAEFALNDYRKLIPKKAQAQKDLELSNYYGEFTLLYFKYSSALEENKKLEILLDNLRKRVSIVKKRTLIGKDRKADLFALESQLHRLEADLSTSQVAVETTRTNFINFSGLVDSHKIDDKVDPKSLKLEKKINLTITPSLTNLKLDEEASNLNAEMEEATNYPQVDLGFDYYVDKSSLGKNDWEVSLNIKLNLFDFSERSSKIESKKVSHMISKARYDYSRLNTQRVWNNYVENFKLKKRELVSLKKALKRSEASYREQLKDLKRGLVTQIDVIRSLDDVVSLEKLTIKSAFEVKSLYYQAEAYLGNYPKS